MTPFFPVLIIVLLPHLGQAIGGVGAFLTLLVTFVVAPGIDYLLRGRKPTRAWQPPWAYNFSLYFYGLAHFVLITWGAYRFSQVPLSAIEAVGRVLSVGIVTGGVGITYAHELIHRRSGMSRGLGELMLSSVCYGHFAVEHVFGHHVNVGTPKDPVSAERGVSFYRYLPRAVAGSLAGAIRIRPMRVARTSAISLVMGAALTWAWGTQALVFFLLQSVIAFTLLELIDYIEHYGLRREETSSGRYESVKPHHSWDTDGLITSLLLVNLQRHSDHHLHPLKRYELLELTPGAPRLPATYPWMVLLALVPPLWTRVVDPRIPAAQTASR